MDYKLNTLNVKVDVSESIIPDVPHLYFGNISDSIMVFDYDRFFEESQTEKIDYKTFMRINKYYIERIAKNSNQKTSEMFYQNTDGHILVSSDLALLFLSFVDDDLNIYFTNILNDALINGIAFCNGFIYKLASERIPSELLDNLIKERQNDATGDEQ